MKAIYAKIILHGFRGGIKIMNKEHGMSNFEVYPL